MIRRLFDFFRLRHDMECAEFRWMWWRVSEEMIEDEAGLGPMQSALDAFGAAYLKREREAVELFASGRLRMMSFRTERYTWDERRQAYDYAGHGPWVSRSWFDGKELT